MSRVKRPFIFHTTCHCILISACILILLGYMLMSGSGSTDQSFNPDIFSPRRIIIAPMFCLSGYLLVIIGIIKKK